MASRPKIEYCAITFVIGEGKGRDNTIQNMFVSIHDALLKLRDTALCYKKIKSLVGAERTTISISLYMHIYMYKSTELCSFDNSKNLN